MSATTTEAPPTPPAVRTRGQVVEELVQTIQAREAASGNDRKPLVEQVQALEQELLTAPLTTPRQGSKGVVDIDAVLAILRASDHPMTSDELAEASGHEVTAGVKARIVHYMRREGADQHGITEVVAGTGKQRRQGYAFPTPEPAKASGKKNEPPAA